MLVLSVIPGRLSSWEKKLNDVLFVVVVMFVAIRVLGRVVFHGGLIFQFALVLGGFAAGIGILFRIKALVARIATRSEERIG